MLRAVDDDFDPAFTLRLMAKDAGLALDLAERTGVPLLVTQASQSLNTMGVALGHGDEDSIAVLKVLETITGQTARRHEREDVRDEPGQGPPG